MRIQLLPLEIANQIAAGEVIERPASVVKEVLENSIDANATQINIRIEQAGIKLISIQDNGRGIHPDDLKLALSRHGTSKIKSADDLMQIRSLGFRGEALASICAVSKINLASCMPEQKSGWQIQASGVAQDQTLKPIAQPPGTHIEIRDLFFNTPARRKFLRSEKTEFSHIEEIVKRIALSQFNIGIHLVHDNKKIFQLPPATDNTAKLHRLAKLTNQAFAENAIQTDVEIGQLRLWGWLSSKKMSYPQTTLQYFYINGRVIKDKVITHAIRQAYEPFLPEGRHAAYILFFELDPSLVDINVHPTKHEVRFREPRLVHDFIYSSIKRSLEDPTQSSPIEYTNKERFIHHKIPNRPSSYKIQETIDVYDKLSENNSSTNNLFGKIISFFNHKFLITQTNQTLYVINIIESQKLIIEELLKEENIEKQPLLFPETVNLNKKECDLIIQNLDILTDLGFEIALIGENSVVIRLAPSITKGCDLLALISSLAKWLCSDTRLKTQIQTFIIQYIAENKRLMSYDEQEIFLQFLENLAKKPGFKSQNLWQTFM
ncbi:MAG: DNA mismatch repair endonuclease MutL [Gammaproteobacteria bacterium]